MGSTSFLVVCQDLSEISAKSSPVTTLGDSGAGGRGLDVFFGGDRLLRNVASSQSLNCSQGRMHMYCNATPDKEFRWKLDTGVHFEDS